MNEHVWLFYTNPVYLLMCLFVQDELLAELEEMEQEELDKDLLEVEGPATVPLPSVPSTSLPSRPGTICGISYGCNCISLPLIGCLCCVGSV